MGGPLVDEGGALLIVNAADENEVREKIKNDPWYEQGILKLESITQRSRNQKQSPQMHTDAKRTDKRKKHQ
jgi:hypothetical protein